MSKQLQSAQNYKVHFYQIFISPSTNRKSNTYTNLTEAVQSTALEKLHYFSYNGFSLTHPFWGAHNNSSLKKCINKIYSKQYFNLTISDKDMLTNLLNSF